MSSLALIVPSCFVLWQIFKLMKFDSYTRFVRSPIYQSCMLADMEGRPLPQPCQAAKSPEPRRSQATDGPSSSDKSVGGVGVPSVPSVCLAYHSSQPHNDVLDNQSEAVSWVI